MSGRIFKTSILISVFLHLLFFILISPQISSGDFSYQPLLKINFVGVPLDKLFSGKNLSRSERMNLTYNFFRRRIAKIKVLPETVGIKQIEMTSAENFIEVNPLVSEVIYSPLEYENKNIVGPLKERILIAKPSTPKIPAWFSEKLAGPLEVKVLVDEAGDVVFCQKIISSGSYTLDIIGSDYVRDFKFAPHKQPLQEGKIKVFFEK